MFQVWDVDDPDHKFHATEDDIGWDEPTHEDVLKFVITTHYDKYFRGYDTVDLAIQGEGDAEPTVYTVETLQRVHSRCRYGFGVDNPILYDPGEADPLVPDSMSYRAQGYRFKTMGEALRVSSDGKSHRYVQGVSLEPTAFLKWEEEGCICTSKEGALPPPHLGYKIVQNPHQTEECKPAETSEPETNSLGGLFGFAIGTALLASSLKKSEPSAETRVVPEGEVSEDILAPEAGDRAISIDCLVRRDSTEE